MRARHSLSQNFLTDVDVLEAILAEAAGGPSDGAILEIGPGLGFLTAGLLAGGAQVTAVELDRGLAAFLRDRFAEPIDEGRLTLIEGDALDQDLRDLVGPPYDVVANLPYHITSPILHRLLEAAPRPGRLVLMVQREVAERIAAPPGKMSYLSVFVQYHARVRVAFLVPPTAFEPEPAVESAVIVVEPYDADDRLDPETEDGLWRLVQAAFRERRKMIHNVLSRQLPVDAGRVTAALETAGIDPDRRPQTLAVGEWLALREALGPLGQDRRGRREARRRRMTTDPPRPVDPHRRLTPVVRLAPAKINLTLAVVGRRPDGFHDLHSVFVPLTVADRLSLAVRPTGDADTLHVDGTIPGDPADNLVLRGDRGRPAGRRRRLAGRAGSRAGARGAAREAPADRGRARWRLVGRGGGRARGPRGVGRRARRRAPAATPSRMVGSDVPFFAADGPALVEGRGERVAPLHGLHGAPGVLLVTPAVHVGTPGGLCRVRRPPRRRRRRRLRPDDLRAPGRGAPERARAPRISWPGPGVLASANDLLSAAVLVRARARRRAPRADAHPRPAGRACPAPARPSGRSILRRPRRLSAADLGPGRRRRRHVPDRSATHRRPSSPPRSDRSSPTATDAAAAGGESMTRSAVTTTSAPAAVGPYSQAIIAGDLVFCAGQGAIDPITNEVQHGTIEEETERTLRNIGGLLDAAGVDYADVVKTTVFLADMADFKAMNGVYAGFFPDPPPARSTVQVAALPLGFKVEIEVVAYRQRPVDAVAR